MSHEPVPHRKPSEGWARFGLGVVIGGLALVAALYFLVRLLVNNILGEPILWP